MFFFRNNFYNEETHDAIQTINYNGKIYDIYNDKDCVIIELKHKSLSLRSSFSDSKDRTYFRLYEDRNTINQLVQLIAGSKESEKARNVIETALKICSDPECIYSSSNYHFAGAIGCEYSTGRFTVLYTIKSGSTVLRILDDGQEEIHFNGVKVISCKKEQMDRYERKE